MTEYTQVSERNENFIRANHKSWAQKAGMSEETWREVVKFNAGDAGWVIMNIGLAIGAGIVFLPVQVGLVGLCVYFFTILIGYPILYQFQKLYVNVLAEAPDCQDFAGVISGYLGKNWGFLLGILYFLMLAINIFLYATAMTNDSASFLYSFGVTDSLFSDNVFYCLVVLCILVAIASQSERLLFKVSTGMVLTKLCVIAILGLVMIQHWDLANIGNLPSVGYLIHKGILTLPLVVLAIIFIGSLSPMTIYYRQNEKNPIIAQYRALRAMRYAFSVLAVVIIFYTISFNLAVGHDSAVQAYKENVSALAIAAKSFDGVLVKLFSVLLNIIAIMTAFFSLFLGFRDSCLGITVNILSRFMREENINRRLITYGISIFCIVLCWGFVLLNVQVINISFILSPLLGFIGCILPILLVLRVPSFKKYRDWKLIPIALFGLLLIASPFVAFV